MKTSLVPVLLVAVPVAALLAACSEQPAPEPLRAVRTAEVRYDKAQETNRYFGAVQSRHEVNEAFRSAAGSDRFKGILQYSEDALVSTDIQNSPYSCIFDSELTMVNGDIVKVFGWYDNEWGYSNRLVDFIARL